MSTDHKRDEHQHVYPMSTDHKRDEHQHVYPMSTDHKRDEHQHVYPISGWASTCISNVIGHKKLGHRLTQGDWPQVNFEIKMQFFTRYLQLQNDKGIFMSKISLHLSPIRSRYTWWDKLHCHNACGGATVTEQNIRNVRLAFNKKLDHLNTKFVLRWSSFVLQTHTLYCKACICSETRKVQSCFMWWCQFPRYVYLRHIKYIPWALLSW